jgi:hypothetical protein
LAEFDGTVLVAYEKKMIGHTGRDPSKSLLIAQGCGQSFGLAQVIEDPPEFSEWIE